jgi:hypothetical protein
MPAGDAGTGSVTAQGCPTSQASGTWMKVTPSGMKMSGDFTNGPMTVGVDVVRPSDIYAHNQHDGTWKSTDCGYTWKKVSTGTNSDQQNTGSQWYAAIDRNPRRDPSTPPTLYVAQGFGAGGVWKSTNGGVDWTNVWNNNVYLPDGVTNISADVGGDIHEILIPDEAGPNHVLATLHGYFGKGDNNGVFETTDGGVKWIVHKGQTFAFQPHSDILTYFDRNTWIVCHGVGYPTTEMYRTIDGGLTWSVVGTQSNMIGRAFSITGSTMYAGTDFNGGAYKSPDKGITWTKLPLTANQVSWVVPTATKVYASSAYTSAPHIWHASLSDDSKWVDDGIPEGMTGNGANSPGVIFDGSHYIIIAAQQSGGLWRYVEP